MAQPAFVILMTVLLPISLGSHLHGQEGANAEVTADKVPPVIGALEPSESEGGPEVSPAESDSSKGELTSSPVVTVNPKKKQTLTEELFSNPLNYLLLLIVCVYVYLLFLRPNAGRKELREQTEKLKNLKKNDRVVTTAGIHGIVSNINSDAGTITLRVDENTNTKLTIDRMSIRSVLP